MLPFVCQRGSLGKKGEKSQSEQIECSKYVGGSQSATRQCSPGKNLQRPNPNKSGLRSQLAARQLSRTPPLDHLAAPPYMLSDPNAKIEPAEGGATNYPPSVQSCQLIPLVLVCKPPITFLGSKKKIQDLQTVGSQLCAAFPVCWLSFILL